MSKNKKTKTISIFIIVLIILAIAIIALLVYNIVIYGFAVIVMKIFTKEDLNMLPYGQKIGAFLTKIGIYS